MDKTFHRQLESWTSFCQRNERRMQPRSIRRFLSEDLPKYKLIVCLFWQHEVSSPWSTHDANISCNIPYLQPFLGQWKKRSILVLLNYMITSLKKSKDLTNKKLKILIAESLTDKRLPTQCGGGLEVRLPTCKVRFKKILGREPLRKAGAWIESAATLGRVLFGIHVFEEIEIRDVFEVSAILLDAVWIFQTNNEITNDLLNVSDLSNDRGCIFDVLSPTRATLWAVEHTWLRPPLKCWSSRDVADNSLVSFAPHRFGGFRTEIVTTKSMPPT